MDFSIWFLVAAGLVFFMQGGFAMVEAGFTRAKNAANIIMKNLMDFCLGTICFVALGYGILCAEDYMFGLFGLPNWQIFSDYATFDFSGFVFNLVFCATAATIVSGAMSERTKFSAYCIYSMVISAVIYPVEAGWVWNAQGWLAKLGFIDFAGSSAIHMVGGISAFIGAAMLGPRVGKYSVDPVTGKRVAHAIPGHSLTLGALGCFILWFAWYGFNGAAATSIPQMGSIFLTTTIAPAVAATATMMYTWIKNGKPDVSMSLNGALAGLVAITAGCAQVDALGSIIIGAVAGVLVVVAVEFIDLKLHVDDPVGAVAVHCVNGIWGTLAVGLFARPMVVDGIEIASASGLFYGGGFAQLGVQALGVLSIAIWTAVTITITFLVIKKVHGLRAAREDEILGLDAAEHGLASSYADFLPVVNPSLDVLDGRSAPAPEMPIVSVSRPEGATKITKVTIITRQSQFEPLKAAFDRIGITGITVTNVLGYGIQRGGQKYRGVEMASQLLPKIQIDVVISKVPLDLMLDTIKRVLHTGQVGDGKVFIYDVENVVKVRTGEEGYDALQDAMAGDE
ncbi:MAG: ammonium transporter [Oscillospiraceae bacterium]|jgi:Amt family ammonium transporter|nr:ammonium transporter [Oscillospiraceae bacterium]